MTPLDDSRDMTLAELEAMHGAPPKRRRSKKPPAAKGKTSGRLYEIIEGRITYNKTTKEGEVQVPLANFDAKIKEELTHDDGLVERLQFVIEGTLAESGRPLPSTTVPAEKYSAMNWVTGAWGSRALVYAGQSTKDHLRAAIQLLSKPKRRHIYGYTGWRKIGDQWHYLHCDGAISETGAVDGIEVDLPRNLADYRLPAPPDEPTDNIRAALRLLDLLPDPIGVPCLLAPVRALLSEALPVDFSFHFSGTTGARKSEVAAVVQNFFGWSWHGKHLPAGWVSTANFNEKFAHVTKDAIIVVDDFHPHGPASDQAKLHKEADRLLRAAGNRHGRGRMNNTDNGVRESYFPRGLVVSTGEDIPKGQSLRARMLILEFGEGTVDLGVLSELQAAAAAGTLAGFTAALVQWLASRLDDLKTTLPAQLRELRARAAAVQGHSRTPDTMAGLYLASEVLAEFFAEHGIPLDPDRVWRALLAIGEAQAEHQRDDDPVRRFVDLIRSALSSGLAHLADRSQPEVEVKDTALGWRRREVGAGDFTRYEWQPQGSRIGWFDGDGVYLDPDAAYTLVQRIGRDQGSDITLTAQTLWKRLRERGVLASVDEQRQRIPIRKMIAGKRHYVLHVYRGHVLAETGPTGPIGPRPNENKGLDAENVGRFSETPEKLAHETGPRLDERPEDWANSVGRFSGHSEKPAHTDDAQVTDLHDDALQDGPVGPVGPVSRTTPPEDKREKQDDWIDFDALVDALDREGKP